MTGHPTRVAAAEALRGRAGYLEVTRLRDEMGDELERRLTQRTESETLFALRWAVV